MGVAWPGWGRGSTRWGTGRPLAKIGAHRDRGDRDTTSTSTFGRARRGSAHATSGPGRCPIAPCREAASTAFRRSPRHHPKNLIAPPPASTEEFDCCERCQGHARAKQPLTSRARDLVANGRSGATAQSRPALSGLHARHTQGSRVDSKPERQADPCRRRRTARDA
jgi:hypothetical protein